MEETWEFSEKSALMSNSYDMKPFICVVFLATRQHSQMVSPPSPANTVES